MFILIRLPVETHTNLTSVNVSQVIQQVVNKLCSFGKACDKFDWNIRLVTRLGMS